MVEINPYLSLLMEQHEALQALGEIPPQERKWAEEGLTASQEGVPIKPGRTGSRSRNKHFQACVVAGGSKEGDQTVKNGSESTKKASFGEAVFAGRGGRGDNARCMNGYQGSRTWFGIGQKSPELYRAQGRGVSQILSVSFYLLDDVVA